MEFSISVGGLKYHIISLSDDFYYLKGKKFECLQNKEDYRIEVTVDVLKKYSNFNPERSVYSNETGYILDEVVRHCLDYNRMIVHGAAIEHKGNAFLFIAPSGTGKTTHVKLWKDYLKDEVKVINGDKPMLEFGKEIIVHGTPWNGKEGYGENISAPLKAIVVIKQDSVNSFRKLNTNESISNMMYNCFYSIDKECGPKVSGYLTEIINRIPIYELSCNISKEAFDTCYKGLFKNKYPD